MPLPLLAIPLNGLYLMFGKPFKTIKIGKSYFQYFKYKNKVLMEVNAWDNPIPEYKYPKGLEYLEMNIVNKNLKTFSVPEGVKHLHLVGALGKIKIPTLPKSLVSFSVIDHSKSVKIPDLSYLTKLKYITLDDIGLTKTPVLPASATDIFLAENKIRSTMDDKLLERYPKLVMMKLDKKYLKISQALKKKYDGILRLYQPPR